MPVQRVLESLGYRLPAVIERAYAIPRVDDRLAPDALRHRLGELSDEGTARELMDEALAKVAAWSWTAQAYGGRERVEPFWRERHDLDARVREARGHAPVDESRSAAMSGDDRTLRAKTFREFGHDRDGRLIRYPTCHR